MRRRHNKGDCTEQLYITTPHQTSGERESGKREDYYRGKEGEREIMRQNARRDTDCCDNDCDCVRYGSRGEIMQRSEREYPYHYALKQDLNMNYRQIEKP